MFRKHFKNLYCRQYEKKTGLYGFVYDFIDYDAIAELIYETFTSI